MTSFEKGSLTLALLLILPAAAVAGDTAEPSDVEFGCWALLDDCFSDFRMDVGSSRMVYDLGESTSTWVTGDAYHDGGPGDCSWAYDAGDITSGESLALHIGNTHITDLEASYSNTVRKRLYVTEFATSNCTSFYYRTWEDAQIITTATGTEVIDCRADGLADCAGSYSDPTNVCRSPDVVISKPSGGGVWSYLYRVYAGMSSCTSSGCTYESEDNGCTSVDWK